jgi:putative glutamine amidotransferase
MVPRIALPEPHSANREYSERAIVQYEHAIEQARGVPIRVPLNQSPAGVMKVIEHCDGILLPGSNADVDPSKFGATRSPRTAAADPRRDTVDELLLQDAYNMRKPILGICYGLQSLNVYRTGSLIQHIPDFLPDELRTRVNHEAGREIAVAHTVVVDADSRLAQILRGECGKKDKFAEKESQEGRGLNPADRRAVRTSTLADKGNTLVIPVNSSHHQSADVAGDGLRIVARCPDDGIIEALEGTAAGHFVLAVQWHPERSVADDEASRAIFRALVMAAEERHEKLAGEFESVK